MSLPGAIERTPELDRWLRLTRDGTVVVCTGKVEIGQGIKTAIAMIAAEELDVSIACIRVQTADTEITPNEWVTAGSMSVEDSGAAVRVASATARQILLELAADELDVDVESLAVEDGVITSTESNEQTDYWALRGDSHFEVVITNSPRLKNPDTYHTVGKKTTRVDLLAKVQGDVAFVQDIALPGLLHGRPVKPPVVTATLIDCPESLDLPNVEVVRDGSFVGVVAEREEIAVAAAEQLAANCRWQTQPLEPSMVDMPEYLRTHVTKSLPVVDGAPVDEPVPDEPVADDAKQTLKATYYRPYQMHASLGP